MPNNSETSELLLFADDANIIFGSSCLSEFHLELFKIHSWLVSSKSTLSPNYLSQTFSQNISKIFSIKFLKEQTQYSQTRFSLSFIVTYLY